MKTLYLFFILSIFFILLSCATTPDFEKERKLSNDNATYISIWTVFESRVTDDEMLAILNKDIYDDYPLFAWFKQTYYLDGKLYGEFISKLFEICKIETQNDTNLNDQIAITIFDKEIVTNSCNFHSKKQIIEYLKLLKEYFNTTIGIPENMEKKYIDKK